MNIVYILLKNSRINIERKILNVLDGDDYS